MYSTLSRIAATSGVHALLFYGADGGHQADWADFTVRAWLCLSPKGGQPCGECVACQLVSRGTHPDLVIVNPMDRGNFIRLGQIRFDQNLKTAHPPVKDFVRVSPVRGDRKVVLIRQAERMHKDAANALLKILEEPPPYVRFALLTSSIGRILPTVRSRCVALAAPLPSETELAEAYGDRAALAGKMPHLAPLLFGEEDVAARFDRLLHGVLTAQRGSGLYWSEQFRALSSQIGSDEDAERQAHMKSLEALATVISSTQPELNTWVADIVEAHRKIAGNVNPGLVLDALFSQLVQNTSN